MVFCNRLLSLVFVFWFSFLFKVYSEITKKKNSHSSRMIRSNLMLMDFFLIATSNMNNNSTKIDLIYWDCFLEISINSIDFFICKLFANNIQFVLAKCQNDQNGGNCNNGRPSPLLKHIIT